MKMIRWMISFCAKFHPYSSHSKFNQKKRFSSDAAWVNSAFFDNELSDLQMFSCAIDKIVLQLSLSILVFL